MEAGLNLYTTRDRMQTKEDFLSLAKELKEKGLSYMQLSGSPISYAEAKEVIDETGMPIFLTHANAYRIYNDTEALCREHLDMGCRNIGLGYEGFDPDYEDDIVSKVKMMEETAKKIESFGCRFFYHNHYHEFRKMKSGITVFDYIAENAPHLNFTLDTYWVQYGGCSITDMVKKLKGRIGCVHLKDYKIDAEPKPVYAPVGYGNINFPEIVSEMKKAGTEYFFIEQDNVPDIPEGYDDVFRSIKYVRENL